MPYNPAGLFSLVASYFASPGASIRTEQHNPVFEDVASALSSVYLRDGRAPMTGDVNMNGFAINNVVAGNSAGSVATLAQSNPIGGIIDFAGSAAPAGWALCNGQALNRTTYAALFAIVGTTYGAPDASTFSLPDLRGRVTAGMDPGNSTARLNNNTGSGGVNGALLGGAGGEQSHQITVAELPVHTPTGSVATTISHNALGRGQITISNFQVGGSGIVHNWVISDGGALVDATINASSAFTGNQIGSFAFHNNVQPTLVLNKIIRISYDV